MKTVLAPTFSHKVSSVLSIKDEASGALFGDYELVWDRENMTYIMRPIEDGQTSIYD
jgi:hypothetical protein